MKPLLDLEAEGVTVRLHRIPAAGIPAHAHPRRHAIWVLAGEGRLTVEDLGDLQLEPGSFVYIPSTLCHEFHRTTEGMEILTVTLPPYEAQ